MLDLDRFVYLASPFPHFVCEQALPVDCIRAINTQWPAAADPRWFHEDKDYARKSAIMFPKRLPEAPQALAEILYSEKYVSKLGKMVGIDALLPDPWFTEGPPVPRCGGGLHEIGPGGLLKMHVDFDAHPTGLMRVINLLIYLNEDWDEAWGGKLELHSREHCASYAPLAGTAVLFLTNGNTWHGHPEPLQCPQGRARRSLALYYYRRPEVKPKRKTTVYQQ